MNKKGIIIVAIIVILVIILVLWISGLRKKYGDSNNISFEKQLENLNDVNNRVTTIDIETAITINNSEKKSYTLNQEEIYQIFNIIDNLTFTKETCDGLPKYYIKYNSENKNGFLIYGIEEYDNKYHITYESKGEAILSNEQFEQLLRIINKYFS